MVATNQGDRVLYLFPCVEEEQSSAGSWNQIVNPECSPSSILHRLARGAADSAFVGLFSVPGTFRIGVSYGTDSSGTKSGEAFSNSFAVVQ